MYFLNYDTTIAIQSRKRNILLKNYVVSIILDFQVSRQVLESMSVYPKCLYC